MQKSYTSRTRGAGAALSDLLNLLALRSALLGSVVQVNFSLGRTEGSKDRDDSEVLEKHLD
jgi:hypothetical protein